MTGEQVRLLLIAFVVVVSVALIFLGRKPVDIETEPEVALEPRLPDVGSVPDFASIVDVEAMKESFFAFLLPVVSAQNAWIRDVREHLTDLQARLEAGEMPGERDQELLESLAERYRMTLPEPPGPGEIEELLVRADVIPPSLVLAQAAAESGWGRSRFAREGNNLFGEWCFVEGCGIVPLRRPPGARHEVARFDDVREAVDSYFRNLNSHPAYAPMRELRAQARDDHGVVQGPQLVDGLEMYSERRGDYLDELRVMIRVNRLTRFDGDEPLETAGVGSDLPAGAQ